MATPIYRNCLRAFCRRLENVTLTITAGTPDTFAGDMQRFTFTGTTTPSTVDYYFWEAGQALLRVLMGLTFDEVYKISPSLIKNKSAVVLTTGVGAITDGDIYKIFERQKVYTTGGGAITAMAKMLDTWERDEIINSLNPRKTPSITKPYFEVIDTAINVYPTSFTRIDLRYIKSCPLQVSSNANSDPFPEGLSDIWTDIACRIASGDMKDSLEQIIIRLLQDKYSFLSRPKQKTPATKEIVG